jgi:predicted enzyme related to lactoylglutathione lyase
MSDQKKLDRRALLTTLAAGAAATGLAATAKAQPEDLRLETMHEGGEPGAIWWNEYLANDANRMNHFYANVIGWRMKLVSLEEPSRLATPDEKGYMVMLARGEETAGVMRLVDADFQGARAGWFTYIQVDDVDAAARRTVQLGGRVLREPVDSDENMRIAVIQDPEGCLVGLAAKRAV